MKQYFGLGLIEITFLVYGLYLLNKSQYLTLLILLVLSTILITKGIHHKESIFITIVFLLFITEYHKYFPYREAVDTEYIENNEPSQETQIENFKSKVDLKFQAEKAERRKKLKEKKKIKKRLKIEMEKNTSNLPIQYLKNNIKINEKAKSWSESLSKWYLFKENLFILLNKKSEF
jgi:hypothetical protein